MNPIKKVVLAGASGKLGPVVLDQLLKHVFEVTVLTRQATTHTFPPSVKVSRVDYGSRESLVSALRGQDAVVSTIGSFALDSQLLLIDAAAAAGVRRFIPSEFGSDTTNPKTAALPVYRDKVAAQKALREHAAAAAAAAATGTDGGDSGGMSYTVLLTGPFLDWGLTQGFMSLRDRRATLCDGGDGVFSTTTLHTIARAVCGVLARPAETANRVLRVHDTATTLNRLLEMAQRATTGGGPEGWTVEHISTEALVQKAWADFRQGRRDVPTMVGFIRAAVWGEGYGAHFETPDNALLGLREMTDAEVQAVVDRLAKE